MTDAALKIINDELTGAGLHYEFGVWNSDVVYPYFVGEYTETESMNEDGLQESTFILNGFTKGTWLELETAKQTIAELFPSVGGKSQIASDGTAVAIFFSDGFSIPTGNAELKRLQVNLRIKEWR